ncbi:MAG: PspC domain-containing protein [Myxococcales bacterium]|nr:PspC domain-containing protein [Myxococcales bacterium]MCB9712322.1 PspC domain-containing protein [Myxococcales bacterium]
MQLRRSDRNRRLFGVCGGLGEQLGIDPFLVRIGFVLLALAGGPGLLAYAILTLLMPPPRALPGGPRWSLPGR